MHTTTEVLAQRLFTVVEYDRMVEVGVLAEDDRVELVRGVIREMSPKNSPHAIAVWKIRRVLDDGLRDRGATFSEVPIALEALDSKPEADVAVMSHPDGELFGTDASEPLLVVEVSDSSLRYDLTEKAALYGQARSPITGWSISYTVFSSFSATRETAFMRRAKRTSRARASRPCRGPISRSM